MPNLPPNFRPKPTPLATGQVASSFDPLQGLPKNMPPAQTTAKGELGPRQPRRRTLRTVTLKEPNVSIANWDVSPFQIIKDLDSLT